jgi:hypothetical protein
LFLRLSRFRENVRVKLPREIFDHGNYSWRRADNRVACDDEMAIAHGIENFPFRAVFEGFKIAVG